MFILKIININIVEEIDNLINKSNAKRRKSRARVDHFQIMNNDN